MADNKHNTTRNGKRSTRHGWKPGYGGRARMQRATNSDASSRDALTLQARERFAGRNSMVPGSMRSASPFEMLDEFARDVESLFDSFGLGRRNRHHFGGYVGGMEGSDTNALQRNSWGMNAGWNPQIEAFYNEEGDIVVSADLPGVKKDDIDCRITKDHVLILSGERKNEREERDEETGHYMSERSYGTFRRTMKLPDNVDSDGVSASFEDGVLTLTIATLKNEEEEDSATKINII